nr:hypothetical protein BgiMline_016616 [Biomphalaria glabrata]
MRKLRVVVRTGGPRASDAPCSSSFRSVNISQMVNAGNSFEKIHSFKPLNTFPSIEYKSSCNLYFFTSSTSSHLLLPHIFYFLTSSTSSHLLLPHIFYFLTSSTSSHLLLPHIFYFLTSSTSSHLLLPHIFYFITSSTSSHLLLPHIFYFLTSSTSSHLYFLTSLLPHIYFLTSSPSLLSDCEQKSSSGSTFPLDVMHQCTWMDTWTSSNLKNFKRIRARTSARKPST